MKLANLRRKVDRLDDQLVRLLEQRADVAREIGMLKRQDGSSVFAPAREAALLRRLEAKLKGGLLFEDLRAVYREILSSARKVQGGASGHNAIKGLDPLGNTSAHHPFDFGPIPNRIGHGLSEGNRWLACSTSYDWGGDR